MKIKEVTKTVGGYKVFFEDIDMVAFVHKPKEIEDLRKQGFIAPVSVEKIKKVTAKYKDKK